MLYISSPAELNIGSGGVYTQSITQCLLQSSLKPLMEIIIGQKPKICSNCDESGGQAKGKEQDKTLTLAFESQIFV